MENNKTLAFLPKEELLQLQEQSKEQKRSKELAESLKEKLEKAQEVRFSSSDHNFIVEAAEMRFIYSIFFHKNAPVGRPLIIYG